MVPESKIWIFTVLFFPLILWTGCYEPPEGCRDIHALNYDVQADKDCDNNCCKYPALKVDVRHLYNGTPIDTSSYFNHSSVDSLKIRYLAFYLSDFRLSHGLDNEEATIIESIETGQLQGGVIEYNSIPFPVAKFKLEKSGTYSLGTFSQADLYSALELDFGIGDAINFSDMSKIPTNNPLYQNQDSMYISTVEGFYFLKMILNFRHGEPMEIRLSGKNQLIPLLVQQEFDFRERTDRIIYLTINYDKWLDGIDFKTENETMIGKKMLLNLEKSFSFE